MRDPAASVGHNTTLSELGIDDLDLPMVCLDLEDAYGMQFAIEDDVETVGDLVASLVASLAAKKMPRRPRSRGGWMSTGIDRRR